MPEVELARTSRILPFGHGRRTVFGSVFLIKNNSTFEFTEFEFSEFLVTAPDVQSHNDYGAHAYEIIKLNKKIPFINNNFSQD